jgi:hypothetical protein
MFRSKLVFLQRGRTQAAELIRSVQHRQALIGSLRSWRYLPGFIATGLSIPGHKISFFASWLVPQAADGRANERVFLNVSCARKTFSLLARVRGPRVIEIAKSFGLRAVGPYPLCINLV